MKHNETKVKSLLENIIFSLQTNNESDWANFFEEIFAKFSSSQDKNVIVKEIINIYRGGMGSFSDLVLQKDMKMLIKENEQLAKLKHELFNSCLNFLKKQ